MLNLAVLLGLMIAFLLFLGYDKPDGSVLSAQTDTHKVYYHKLGTKQSQDKLIKGGADFQKEIHYGKCFDDNRFLILNAVTSTNGNELYIKRFEEKHRIYCYSEWI